ncbi:MAG: flagellar biosynthetic protein FliR [Gemmatimonadaceae bacterium]|nr:flagellar biosynthetic protein FliR [Gemmatimonadaceae bacterium]
MIGAGAAAMPELLTAAGAATFILLVARIGGLVLIAPIFAAKAVPMKLRTALLVIFSLVLLPVARAHAEVAPVLTPLTMLSETIIGFGLGLGSAIVIAGASAAGDMVSVQMGLAGASVLDPMTNIQVPVMGQFMTAFATLLLFASGGHLVMLSGLGDSLDVLPIGSVPDLGAGLLAMSKLGGQVLMFGVMFSAPVMAATMLTNVALAILTRAAPQLQIITVAFPLQIMAGLFTMAAALSLISVWFTGWATYHDGMLQRILGPMLASVR